MDTSTETLVLKKINSAKRGTLFFVDDFLDINNYKSISKALERLVNKGEISRVARGIYARLINDPVLGEIKPTLEEIAKAIAKKEKARIIPTGTLALNILGLSTQVPMNIVYYTDGSPRKISIGKQTITFKKTSAKNLAVKGKISILVIQALKEIGEKNLTEKEEQIILEHLKNEDVKNLKHDIKLVPEWIRKIMRKALNDNNNE